MGNLANPYRLGTVYHSITQEKPLLYTYQWLVEFVGGGGMYLDYNFKRFTLFDKDESNPDTCFAYWVKGGVKIPNFPIAKASVNFYSTNFRVPACRTFGHDLNLNLIQDQDLTIYDKLDTWLKMISRLNIDGGGMKVIPTVKMRLLLLDSQHQYFTDSFVYEGCWITSLGQMKFQYVDGNAKPLDLAANFKYQYCYRDPDLDLTNDPLSVAKILAAAGTV